MAGKINPDNVSPSRYASFLDCPMKFWIFNLSPNKEEFRNKGKSIGQVVDQTLHRFFSREADNRILESLDADFKLVWDKERANNEWSILPTEEEKAKIDSWDILKLFFENFPVNKTPIYIPPLSSDPHKFDALLKKALTPNLVIRGWGDRLDKNPDGFEVIDYKTKSGAELFEEKNTIQLRMYGLLFDDWIKNRGLEGSINKLTFVYLTTSGIQSRSFNFTKEDREDTIKEIKELNIKMKQIWNEFGTKTWPCQCGTCDRLLNSMEAHAEEWAREMHLERPKEPVQDDLPF